jgi:S-adenosylmethionine-diacylgycerolhomoserine-N-methlytransferase
MTDASFEMDRIYGWQTGLYDATRAYYLLGRDRLIESLAPPHAARVLEIGCGTGRNLIKGTRRWPGVHFFGIDISRVMLTKARRSIMAARAIDHISIAHADATRFDPVETFGVSNFQRIYFSYTLSMIPQWIEALDHAAQMLPAGGALFVADFGDQRGLPVWFRKILRLWLSLFHVTPRDDFEPVLRAIAQARGLNCEFVSLYRGYAFLAALRRPV